MFRTVIVGFDEPERGGDALSLAECLRDPREGELVIVSAYRLADFPFESLGSPDQRDELQEQALASLAGARERFHDDHPARVLARPGPSPARVLTEVAESERADLVVVGSTHRIGVGRVLPGTTAERLLHGAPCAVAIAPRGFDGSEIRHVGVAYDGSPEARAALAAAEKIALERHAALTVFCVVEPASSWDSMIAAGTGAAWPSQLAHEHARELLYEVVDNAPAGLHPETLLLRGRAAEEISRRCAAAIDLLAVGSRGYGPLQRALLGSVSGDLVRGAGCPVLVLPRSAGVPAGNDAQAATRVAAD